VSVKNIKSGNFQVTTVNQNIYIFGIARNEEERKLVINEANQINDVEEVVSSIFLVSDLTNNQRLKN
jgi:osmotically-inducible protein OsmY